MSSGGIGLLSSTFPLALPNLAVTKLKVSMHDMVGVSRSPFTASRQIFDWQQQVLGVSVELPAGCQQDTARAWVAWLALLRGGVGTFLWRDTSLPVPRGNPGPNGQMTVNGSNQSGGVLQVVNLPPSQSLVLRSGDWIQTGYPPRIYMNLLDTNSGPAGQASLTIYPYVRESPANGMPVYTQPAQGTFALASNDREYDVDDAMNYGISFDAVEAL